MARTSWKIEAEKVRKYQEKEDEFDTKKEHNLTDMDQLKSKKMGERIDLKNLKEN